jgi:hypothetical protein
MKTRKTLIKKSLQELIIISKKLKFQYLTIKQILYSKEHPISLILLKEIILKGYKTRYSII